MCCLSYICNNYFGTAEAPSSFDASPFSTDLKTFDVAKAILIGGLVGLLIGACVTGPLFSLPILGVLYLAGVSTETLFITGITIVASGALYSSYLCAKEKLKTAQEESRKIN